MISKTLILAVLFLVASNVQAVPADGTTPPNFGTPAKRASGGGLDDASPISSRSCPAPARRPKRGSLEDGTCCARDRDCRSGTCIIEEPPKKDIPVVFGHCTCFIGYQMKSEADGPEGACCITSNDCINTCVKHVCRGN
ncbi:MAG: hypothetical protein J3Q66DRAFT_369855 [Benniella sp.]|nr:MAG: hypothetical protein J3Q66DRAFT_369855 [Benniella sp.]